MKHILQWCLTNCTIHDLYLIAISGKVVFNEDIDAPSISKACHDLEEMTNKVLKSPFLRAPTMLSNGVCHKVLKQLGHFLFRLLSIQNWLSQIFANGLFEKE